MTDVHNLLPELAEWNDGKGVDPLTWLTSVARSDVAVGYSLLFWPTFVRVGPYVLREGYDGNSLRAWENTEGATRKLVEATVNTVYLDDMLFQGEAWNWLTERRSVHLGRVLREVYSLKLAHDFPKLRFEVSLFDGQQAGGEISLSFWQADETAIPAD